MKKSKLPLILMAIILLPLLAIGGVLLTLDPNSYREQIATSLSEKLGRKVVLGGPIKLNLSLDGVSFSISQVSIANPSWGSRAEMAKVGSLELGIAVPPLLHNELRITGITLKQADIQMEQDNAGKSNFDLAPAASPAPVQAPPVKTEKKDGAAVTTKPMSLQFDKVDVDESRFGVLKNGKLSAYVVHHFKIRPDGKTLHLHFDGELEGKAVTADLTTDTLDKVSGPTWNFKGDISYAQFKITLQGRVLNNAKEAAIDYFQLRAGKSTLTGEMRVALSGARPMIVGKIEGDSFAAQDFAMDDSSGGKGGSAAAPAPANNSQRVFSTAPIKLDGLKAVDAKLEIKIGSINAGPSPIKDMSSKIDLTNGRLLLSPLRLTVAGSEIVLLVKVDGSTAPAQISATGKAHQIDLSQLVSLWGIESLIVGKSDLDFDVATAGNSAHDFASGLDGQLNMVMAGGEVSSHVMGEITDSLMGALAQGGSTFAKSGVNCAVTRFKINKGMMQSNGILIDSAAGTIVGSGGVNLRDELVDMRFRTRSKVVDIGQLLPSLHVTGSLKQPKFTPDASSALTNVASAIFAGGAMDDGVPDMEVMQGQNSCVYTIDHPSAKKAAQPGDKPGLVKDMAGKAHNAVGGAVGNVINGLGGLLGQ